MNLLAIITIAQKNSITLNNTKLILNNFNFYIDTIIDARKEKNCIGIIQKSKDNIKPLFFKNNFNTEMNYLFSTYLN